MSRQHAYTPRSCGGWSGPAARLALALTVAVACYGGDLTPTVCESAGGVICVAPAGDPSGGGECMRFGYPLEMYPGGFFRPPPAAAVVVSPSTDKAATP